MSTHDGPVAALLARPSVEGLIYALRHPDTWPAGFRFNYA